MFKIFRISNLLHYQIIPWIFMEIYNIFGSHNKPYLLDIDNRLMWELNFSILCSYPMFGFTYLKNSYSKLGLSK